MLTYREADEYTAHDVEAVQIGRGGPNRASIGRGIPVLPRPIAKVRPATTDLGIWGCKTIY